MIRSLCFILAISVISTNAKADFDSLLETIHKIETSQQVHFGGPVTPEAVRARHYKTEHVEAFILMPLRWEQMKRDLQVRILKAAVGDTGRKADGLHEEVGALESLLSKSGVQSEEDIAKRIERIRQAGAELESIRERVEAAGTQLGEKKQQLQEVAKASEESKKLLSEKTQLLRKKLDQLRAMRDEGLAPETSLAEAEILLVEAMHAEAAQEAEFEAKTNASNYEVEKHLRELFQMERAHAAKLEAEQAGFEVDVVRSKVKEKRVLSTRLDAIQARLLKYEEQIDELEAESNFLRSLILVWEQAIADATKPADE